jgi:hypothetical protein
MTFFDYLLCAIVVAVSLACLGHLWLRNAHQSSARKVLWSLLALLPLVGPLLYGAFYDGAIEPDPTVPPSGRSDMGGTITD